MSSKRFVLRVTKDFWVCFVQNDDSHKTKLDSRALKWDILGQ